MQNIILSKDITSVINLNILKAHLRIEHNHEDEYLKTIIKMATKIIEDQLEESLLVKEYLLSYYPDISAQLHKVKLPIRNTVRIIKVIQNEVPISYKLQRNTNEISFVPKSFDSPVSIYYSAGIATDLQHVPDELKFVILQVAKNIYDCSEENILESNYIKNVLQRRRYIRL